MLTHSSIKAVIHGRRAHVEPDWLILVLSMAMSQIPLIRLWHTTGSHVGRSLLRLRSHMPSERVLAYLRSVVGFSLIPSLDHILGHVLIVGLINRPCDTVPSSWSFQWGLSLGWSASNDVAWNKAWTIGSRRWLSFFPFFWSWVMVLTHRKAWLVNIVKFKFTKPGTFVSKVIWSQFIALSINFIWIFMVVSCLCRCQQQLLNWIWAHSTNSLSTWVISKHLQNLEDIHIPIRTHSHLISSFLHGFLCSSHSCHHFLVYNFFAVSVLNLSLIVSLSRINAICFTKYFIRVLWITTTELS